MIKMLSKKGLSTLLTESGQNLALDESITPWKDIYDPFAAVSRKIGGITEPDNMLWHMITLPVAR
jgi:hypothetical protein